jgi:hypothetical protein
VKPYLSFANLHFTHHPAVTARRYASVIVIA